MVRGREPRVGSHLVVAQPQAAADGIENLPTHCQDLCTDLEILATQLIPVHGHREAALGLRKGIGSWSL